VCVSVYLGKFASSVVSVQVCVKCVCVNVSVCVVSSRFTDDRSIYNTAKEPVKVGVVVWKCVCVCVCVFVYMCVHVQVCGKCI
jgi:purine-cytosine permease-like protein